MPIKRRLSAAERLSLTLGEGWQRVFDYGHLGALTKSRLAHVQYDASPENISRAFTEVNGWKKPSYRDKVVIHQMCSIMWRAFGRSPMSDANYDKLTRHLLDHDQDILSEAGLPYFHAILWDGQSLAPYGRGQLKLPPEFRIKPRPPIKFKVKPRPKR